MKRRGKMIITLELLKELLQLDPNEEIVNLYRSSDDMERDCFSIIIASNTESKNTLKVVEGGRLKLMKHDKAK